MEDDELTHLKDQLEMYFEGLDGMRARGEVTSTNVQALGIAIMRARRQGSRMLKGLTLSPSYDVVERTGQGILDVLAQADANAPDNMLELEALVDERLKVDS
jgi:hypothetical protein